MALIQASYTVHRNKAYAGMIADTSLYNVDGTCCAGVDKLPVGIFVVLDKTLKVVDGHKVVTNVVDTAEANPQIIGATIMSHAYSPEGTYDEGSAVNVATHGRVWMLCDKTLTDADKALGASISINAKGEVVKAGTASALVTVHTSTGEWLKTDDTKYDLIKVQITQAQFQLQQTP